MACSTGVWMAAGTAEDSDAAEREGPSDGGDVQTVAELEDADGR